MKAYKIEVLVIDFDKIGEDYGKQRIVECIENANYPNDCIAPNAYSIQEADIGEWLDDDSHPLNQCPDRETIERYFKQKNVDNEQIKRLEEENS